MIEVHRIFGALHDPVAVILASVTVWVYWEQTLTA